MSVLPIDPAIPRDSAACGVFRMPAARMSSARPGASRSITARVASGVTSRGPKPVPPVVTMRPVPRAARSLSRASIAPRSSATRERSTEPKPAERSADSATSPERSSRVPAETPSETVSTAARTLSIRLL